MADYLGFPQDNKLSKEAFDSNDKIGVRSYL
jgi:hypothetical protein